MFINTQDSNLQTEIENYIVAQSRLQGVENPSGSLADGSGLGEPKFNVDLSQFTGDWGEHAVSVWPYQSVADSTLSPLSPGRPQRDGPALRAIALISYAKWLIADGRSATVAQVLWPIIQNDLAYVAQYW